MLYKMMHNRIYLGEILHKEKYYPGQHQAIIDQDLWDAVHAILAENNRQRASETLQRRQPEALLLGLFYTQDGERFQPAFTRKANGKMYRYYVPIRKVRFGAKATGAGRLPAEPIEQLVLAQVHAALKAPEVVQSVCDTVAATTPEVTEPEVVLALRHLGDVWEQLFPAERQRIVQLLIERVTLRDEGSRLPGGMWDGPPWWVRCSLARLARSWPSSSRCRSAWHDADHSNRRGRPAAGREAHDTDSGPHQAKWRAQGGDTGGDFFRFGTGAPHADPHGAVACIPLAAPARRGHREKRVGHCPSGGSESDHGLGTASADAAVAGQRTALLAASRQPKTLTLRWLKNHELPADWEAQRGLSFSAKIAAVCSARSLPL
jgi:hypothetical protein